MDVGVRFRRAKSRLTLVAVRKVLRSPPFPGVTEQAASINGAFDHNAPPRYQHARLAAAAMAAARVGGHFWGRAVEGRIRLVVADGTGSLPDINMAEAIVVAKGGRCAAATRRGATVVSDDIDPWPLIEGARTIHAPRSSEIALLALAAGRLVVDHAGAPVDDEDGALFDSGLLGGLGYRHPIEGRPIDVMEAIGILGEWRRQIDANRGVAVATGIAFWKRREIARLLWDGRSDPIAFLKPSTAIERAARMKQAVVAWPARVPRDFEGQAVAAGVAVRWIEDGFLRSVGLGSALVPPLSVTVDDLGPHFDPAQPSRLEQILSTHPFDDALRQRAGALRQTIVAGRIGKYQAGGTGGMLSVPPGRRVVLVIGQVADDLSVVRGGGAVAGNLDLLRRVRAEEPAAYVIYRPHPDVQAGHRSGAIADADADRHADMVMQSGSLDAAFGVVDAVHVLTSLTGFEALLRGCRVVTHGGPFYAGWGLTDDRGASTGRRTRRLTVDELVAGALIVYPRYLDPRTGLPCTVEAFIDGVANVARRTGALIRMRQWQGRMRRSIQICMSKLNDRR